MTAGRTLYLLLGVAALAFLLSLRLPSFVYLGTGINLAILFGILADFYLTPSSRLISGRRFVSSRLSIGRKNTVNIEIFNKAQQAVKLRLKDSYPEGIKADIREFVFEMSPDSAANLEYFLLPQERGAYEFGDIFIRFSSRLGFFTRELRLPARQELKVYPDLKALQELSVKLAHSSELGEIKVRKRGQGTDFATLREYVNGDDVRSIDWKATARRDRPVVRIYEVEKEQTLMVLLDAGRMMVSDLEGLSRFDHALNAALSLVLTGLMRNDQVGLGIFADRPLLFMPPRRGKSYLTRIIEACSDIHPSTVEPDYLGALSFFAGAHKQRSLMVVLSDLTDPTGSQSLLTGLASLSPRHLPFCVTLRDREVDRIAHQSCAATEDIMRRAVAIDLNSQRDLAFTHLIRRGCLVLDCPPQELSSKLVDKYLEIKSRALL